MHSHTQGLILGDLEEAITPLVKENDHATVTSLTEISEVIEIKTIIIEGL